jgi:hypothetical protein
MDSDLTIATTTDSAATARAAAHDNEEGARTPAPKVEVERLDGSTAVSFEHDRSERKMLLERLVQHEADLADLSTPEPTTGEISSTEESTEQEQLDAEAAAEQAGIDLNAVREQATRDAIEAGRRWANGQQPQAGQPTAADIDRLRADLAKPFFEKVKAIRARTPDYDAVMDGAKNIMIPVAVGDALLALPGGPEASVHLARNPREAAELAQLPDHVAVARAAALCSRLDAASRRPISRAAAPIRPVGTSSTKSSVPADELSYQDYKRAREREIKARRGR